MSGARPILPGLCSVTFRGLDADRVIDVAAAGGAAGIEWGGDVHLPPGSLDQARRIGSRSADAGLVAPSYGSYLRLSEDEPADAGAIVLDTAQALGAGNVRVWAGRNGPQKADDRAAARIAERLHALCELAAARRITISLEFHRRTLTETAEAALRLVALARHDNLFSYWQPVPERGEAAWRAELAALVPVLSHLHVFHWLAGNVRRPLREGEGYWRRLIAAFDTSPRWQQPAFLFLEFVADESIEQAREDLAVLGRLCRAEEVVNSIAS